jgi:SAM-dependent methyltransferase
MAVDFGRTSADYATHRAGFPSSFYSTLDDMGVAVTGSALLDLGTGTGTLARGFAARGARVQALDPSSEMLEQARVLAQRENLTVDFINASAEATGLPVASIDIVTAGQCWHWFDRPRAAAECARVLRPGGQLIIAHYDWIPLPGNLLELTESLITEHNPDWRGGGGKGVYPWWFADATNAGFVDLQSRTYDEDALYSHQGWRGRVRASAGVAASLDGAAVAAFDADLQAAMKRHFPADALQVHHRVFILKATWPG